VHNYDYDAFGNQRAGNSGANPFRYCGEYFDSESGYIYLRARYYDPSIGRFVSEDPAFDGDNWYVYCGNDPVNRIDPSGEFWHIIGGAAIGAAVGFISNAGSQLIANRGNFGAVAWRSAGAAAAAGAVSGAMIAATGGLSLGATMAGGALAGGAGYSTYHTVNGSQGTVSGAVKSMAVGAVTGGVVKAVPKAVAPAPAKTPAKAPVEPAPAVQKAAPAPAKTVASAPNVKVPSFTFNKPSKSPGSGWEWRGPGKPGTPKGAWFKPKTGETLHPNLDHKPPIGPHWDYIPYKNGPKYRVNANGKII